MSLFSSIRMANNTLRADQIALQVVGQNIANAETPGYVREEVILQPAASYKFGGFTLGLGVEVEAIVQKIDHFLEERLRGSVSDRSSAEVQEQAYQQLEGLIRELNDTDLSSDFTRFFSAISEVLNQPESAANRNQVVLQGRTLAQNIKRLYERVNTIRQDFDKRVETVADRINRLTSEIQQLNIRISEMEGGSVSKSDAVGLRDRRNQALEELAGLIDIRVEEQPSSGVAVYSGGLFLVYEGTRREVEVSHSTDRGIAISEVHLAETDSNLETAGGELHGLIQSRDEVLGGFVDRLNELASALIFEFNKIYSSGQGLSGYQDLTSSTAVTERDVPLDAAGLPFTPVNGGFDLLLRNTNSGVTQSHAIRVNLTGIQDDDTTLEDLADQINAIDGLEATILSTGKLRIRATAPDTEFAFANDTSGILAALGLNTFFVGRNARDIAVNTVVAAAPKTFAASSGGIGADTQNAVTLAAFIDQPLASFGGVSISAMYDSMIAEVTQGAAVTTAEAESARTFESTLRGQKLAISGVNLDEEAIRMIMFQRQFQASARYIKTLTDLLDILVNI
ncbi:flagellar hook-associated protein FlgK [Thermopirellula anaerolimosa]